MVNAWRYEGATVDVPWEALGGVLFEMGASSCSVSVGGAREDEEDREGNGGIDDARGAAAAAGAGSGEEGQEEAMLSFVVAGGLWADVGAALELACDLAGGPEGCFGERPMCCWADRGRLDAMLCYVRAVPFVRRGRRVALPDRAAWL